LPSAEKKAGYIDVDELMPQITLEQAAAYYGVGLPELHRAGNETRTRCFLNCGKACETGDRVLAIQTDHPAKQWKCHQYECGKGGKLISLCDLMRSGQNAGGRPRGEWFKEIAADLKAMAAGLSRLKGAPPATAAKPAPAEVPKVNVPLAHSDNERARALVNLDEKFVLDPANMPPAASAYFRRRPFLTPEVCKKWRMGYLPRDAGGDHAGGTMRGKVVYPYCSESGELLTWFGRDPEYEDKHRKWEAGGKADKEPEKFHFVKGFHRGIELWGQHALDGLKSEEEIGLVLVEGPNDVVRLHALGVPTVGLCSNAITREQAAKVASLARRNFGSVATVLLDCDPEGENGMRQALGYLAQLVPVRLAWTSKMYRGKFKGRQPESLTLDEWEEMSVYLGSGDPNAYAKFKSDTQRWKAPKAEAQ